MNNKKYTTVYVFDGKGSRVLYSHEIGTILQLVNTTCVIYKSIEDRTSKDTGSVCKLYNSYKPKVVYFL